MGARRQRSQAKIQNRADQVSYPEEQEVLNRFPAWRGGYFHHRGYQGIEGSRDTVTFGAQ